MSTVTRCPGCTTAFRVTSAQLEVRHGQVRCGRCGHVFDARAAQVFDVTPGVTEGSDRQTGRQAVAKDVRTEVDFGTPSPPRKSWLWWPACAVVSIALAAQLAFHFRGELALLWPAAKPILAQLCRELGCRVPLPKHADLISIETSDLQAEGAAAGVIVLSATIRNRAAFPQQFPALELTLTNAQDELVARRVLTGRDYLARNTNPEAGLAGNSEVAIKVFIEAAALKPTGYRLYLFYP